MCNDIRFTLLLNDRIEHNMGARKVGTCPSWNLKK